MCILGPPDGLRIQPITLCLRFPIPSTRPISEVVLPSPSGVGVIAVTSTYLPSFLCFRRSIILRKSSFGVLPKGISSSFCNPSLLTHSSGEGIFFSASSAICQSFNFTASYAILEINLLNLFIYYFLFLFGVLLLGSPYCVHHEHGDGHGSHAAGYGGDSFCLLFDSLEIGIAHQPEAALLGGVGDPVDADIDDHNAVPDHIRCYHLGFAHSGDKDIRLAGILRHILCSRVYHGYRCVGALL